MLYCPYCHLANRDGSRFCNGCGQPLGLADVQCADCGTGNLPGSRFCQQCGAPLDVPARPAVAVELSPDDAELPDLEADAPTLDALVGDGLTGEDRTIVAWYEAFTASPAAQPLDSELTQEDRAIIAWYEALGPAADSRQAPPTTVSTTQPPPRPSPPAGPAIPIRPPLAAGPPLPAGPPLAASQPLPASSPSPAILPPAASLPPEPPPPVQADAGRAAPPPRRKWHLRPARPHRPTAPQSAAAEVESTAPADAASTPAALPATPIEVGPPAASVAAITPMVAPPVVAQAVPSPAAAEQPAIRETPEAAPVAVWAPPDWLELAEPEAAGGLALPDWLFLAEPGAAPVAIELPDWLFLAEPEAAPAPRELPDWLFLEEPALLPAAAPAETHPAALAQAPAVAPERVPVPVELGSRQSAVGSRQSVAEPERVPVPVETLPIWLFLQEPIDLVPEPAPPAPEPVDQGTEALIPMLERLGLFAAGPSAQVSAAEAEARPAAGAPAAAIAGLPFVLAPPVVTADQPAGSMAPVEAAEEFVAPEPEPPPAYDYGGAWSFVRMLREQLAVDEAAARAAAERQAAGLPPLEAGAGVAGGGRTLAAVAPVATAVAPAEPDIRAAVRAEERANLLGWLRTRLGRQQSSPATPAVPRPPRERPPDAPARQGNILTRLFGRRNGSTR